MPKIKPLADFTNIALMKDFVHQIESRGFESEVKTFVNRELVEKLSHASVTEPQENLSYIKRKIEKFEKFSLNEGIEYWEKKINFSMDCTV